MTDYTDASHNVLRTLDEKPMWADLKISKQADIVGYQELSNPAVRHTVSNFCRAADRSLYVPTQGDLGISWNHRTFSVVRADGGTTPTPAANSIMGNRIVHLAAPSMGVESGKFDPKRSIQYIGLFHKSAQKRILRINVHPAAGATRLEAETAANLELDQWKNWAFGQYWLDAVAFTAQQLSRSLPDRPAKPFWDVISIGGDYNGRMDDVSRWYYPASLLSSLYRPDSIRAGVDHMQHTFHSDARVAERWAERGNTDHPISFVRRILIPVSDFPGR